MINIMLPSSSPSSCPAPLSMMLFAAPSSLPQGSLLVLLLVPLLISLRSAPPCTLDPLIFLVCAVLILGALLLVGGVCVPLLALALGGNL